MNDSYSQDTKNPIDSIPLLTVNDRTISVSEGFEYLRKAGGLQRAIAEILRQHLLEAELRDRDDLKADDFQVEQAILDFRVQRQLTDPKQFKKWLLFNGTPFEEFKDRIAFGFQVEKLKAEVTEPQLEEWFAKRKPDLDRVVLSRIIVEDKQLAVDLEQKLAQEPSQFDDLARSHSVTKDAIGNAIPPVRRGSLPPGVRTALTDTNPGDIVGVLEVDDRFCLFRVDNILAASLEQPGLKRELQNELFEKWMREKLAKMAIKLELN